MGIFKSFFSGKAEDPAEEQQKNLRKNFELFKYDGMRAGRMGRLDYAVKCFNEALALQDDFETMGYLAQTYIQTNQLQEARHTLERMLQKEPSHLATLLNLAEVCFMLDDYPAMTAAAEKAAGVNPDSPSAWYLLGKAAHAGGNNDIMAIAHLTKALVLDEDYTEARQLRAAILAGMGQYTEALAEVTVLLDRDQADENALLLRARIALATGHPDEAEADYRRCITVLNPFNEQAYLSLGRLYISGEKYQEAIDLFTEAISNLPAFAMAYHERGRAKLLIGDKEGAAQDSAAALAIRPDEMQGFNGRYGDIGGNSTGDILGL
ncbi:MAG: tetratricopeptide repeat protein [Prevotellaceae bacterium]|nr:tetratricopeptide repeat protein [Prevotellaceae bacterium]